MNAGNIESLFVVYFECSVTKLIEKEADRKLSMSGIQFKMRQRIVRKFQKAGALSLDTAVTFEEAKLDMEELCWLDYFAGSFLGCIKKTRDHKYYI